jgi:hypothetical protein
MAMAAEWVMAAEAIGARRDSQDKGGAGGAGEYREYLLCICHDLISLLFNDHPTRVGESRSAPPLGRRGSA